MIAKAIKPKYMAILILLTASLLLFFRHSQSLFSNYGKIPTDFKVYILAVERVRAGINPYVLTEKTPYKYSPGALAPFFLLPKQETAAWIVFKFFCLMSWIFAILIGSSLDTWQQIILLLLGITISWKGLLETLDYGQIEFIFLFIAVASCRVFERSRFLSGFFLGCLPGLKLQWGLLFFPFLINAIQKDRAKLRRYLLGFATGGIFLMLLVPIWIYGSTELMELMKSWFSILRTQPAELYFGDVNQNIWSTVSRWISHWPTLGLVGGVFLVFWCLCLIISLVRAKLDARVVGSLAYVTPWLILTQLVSPLGWRYGSLLLIGAPFLWDCSPHSQKSNLFWFFSGLIFLLFSIQQNPIAKFMGFQHWTDLNHYGSVTLYWMSILTLCLFYVKNRHPKRL